MKMKEETKKIVANWKKKSSIYLFINNRKTRKI